MRGVMGAAAKMCGKISVYPIRRGLLTENFSPAFASTVIHRGSPREGRQASWPR